MSKTVTIVILFCILFVLLLLHWRERRIEKLRKLKIAASFYEINRADRLADAPPNTMDAKLSAKDYFLCDHPAADLCEVCQPHWDGDK